jgi:hypothetical protein
MIDLYEIKVPKQGSYYEVFYEEHYSTSLFDEDLGGFIASAIGLGLDVTFHKATI